MAQGDYSRWEEGSEGGGQVSIGDPLALCSSHRSLLTTVHWPRDGPPSQQTPLSSAHTTVGPDLPSSGLLSKVTFLLSHHG